MKEAVDCFETGGTALALNTDKSVNVNVSTYRDDFTEKKRQSSSNFAGRQRS